MIHRSQESVLCVDFGLDRLTVVEANAGGVSGWAIRDLPPGLVRNGDPVDAGQLAVLLKQTISESGLSAVRARFTLPDEGAIFRLVELPAMPQRHLHRALSYMLDKDMPLPLDRIRWDWDVLERTDIGYRVCLVAAWRDVIERIVRVASEAGLQLELVEPRSLATARALDRDRVVVFDGSAERLQALYLKRGALPFVDQAPIGRDQETCARTLERLLRKGRTVDDNGATGETVVLAGDLEDVDLPLSMPTLRVSQVLEEQARPAIPGLPSGSLLANLGLADDVLRGYRPDRLGTPDVNLLGPGSNRQQWLRRVERLRVVSAWRAGSVAQQVRSAARAGWMGRVRPRFAR